VGHPAGIADAQRPDSPTTDRRSDGRNPAEPLHQRVAMVLADGAVSRFHCE
jgi:hypothetical protein